MSMINGPENNKPVEQTGYHVTKKAEKEENLSKEAIAVPVGQPTEKEDQPMKGWEIEHDTATTEESPYDKLQKENERLQKENEMLKKENAEKAPKPIEDAKPKKAAPKPAAQNKEPNVVIINNVNPQQINSNPPAPPFGVPVQGPVNAIQEPIDGPSWGYSEPTVEDEKQPEKVRELTNSEVREAASDGKRVAKMLIGYTNTNDQSTVKEVIKDRVNADNVVEFLRGYDEEHGVRGDKIFEQLYTEYTFDDKGELIMDLGNKLAEYCENHGMKYDAEEVHKLVKEFSTHQYTPTDVKEIIKILDIVVQGVIRF